MPIKLNTPKKRYVLSVIKDKSVRSIRVRANSDTEAIKIVKKKYPGSIISILRELE